MIRAELLGELLAAVAFPETPEERDAAEAEIVAAVTSLHARLDALAAVADDLAQRGDNLEAKGNNGSIYSTRAEGRGIGYREAARLIRAAISTT